MKPTEKTLCHAFIISIMAFTCIICVKLSEVNVEQKKLALCYKLVTKARVLLDCHHQNEIYAYTII